LRIARIAYRISNLADTACRQRQSSADNRTADASAYGIRCHIFRPLGI
jgi:hypothetical protein